MKIEAVFGLATARYRCALPSLTNEWEIDLPIGPCVSRWNMKERKRVAFFQAHSDVITFMERSPVNNIICTCSNGGEVKLWDENWKLVSEIHLKDERLTCADWRKDGSQIVVICERSSTMYILDTTLDLRLIGKVSAIMSLVCFNSLSNILAVEQEYTKKENGCGVVLYENTIESKRIFLDSTDVISLIGTSLDKTRIILCCMNRPRHVYILNSETLEVVNDMIVLGSGGIQCLHIDHDFFYVPSSNGSLFRYTMDGMFDKEFKLPSGTVYNLNWAVRDEKWWACIDGRIHRCSVSETKVLDNEEVEYHSLTCCGVDLSPDGQFIVSGDFLGNAIIWDVKTHEIVDQMFIGASIRCIEWIGDVILLGGMDSNLYRWNYKLKSSVDQLGTHSGSIICMDMENGKKSDHIALGTSNGFLEIVSLRDCTTVIKFQAHPPVNEHVERDKFGSIHKFSEVWSLKWSPCNDFIATSSEDQSTKIWNLKGDCLQTIVGHTTAVTGVDWNHSPLGEILITCADDQRIMVWSVKYWKLLCEFKSDIPEWHTLTYLSLSEDGSKVITTTQNGYCLVFCLNSKKTLVNKKFHNGSIEGLKWNGKQLAICSSDCTISLFSTD